MYALAIGLCPWEVFVWASIGNVVGILFNYALGRFGRGLCNRSAVATRVELRARTWIERYGRRAVLASWLPVIGDPLTVAAGFARIDLVYFTFVAGGLRLARYAAICAAVI